MRLSEGERLSRRDDVQWMWCGWLGGVWYRQSIVGGVQLWSALALALVDERPSEAVRASCGNTSAPQAKNAVSSSPPHFYISLHLANTACITCLTRYRHRRGYRDASTIAFLLYIAFRSSLTGPFEHPTHSHRYIDILTTTCSRYYGLGLL